MDAGRHTMRDADGCHGRCLKVPGIQYSSAVMCPPGLDHELDKPASFSAASGERDTNSPAMRPGPWRRRLGKVTTHQGVMETIWPTERERRVEYVRIVVRNLRLKLEGTSGVGTVIANELGIGYRLLVDH